MKTCSKCGVEKDLDEFYTDNYKKDGKSRICKVCAKFKSAKYQKDNPEKIKAAKAKYKKANPEKVKAAKAKYKRDNPEKVRAAMAKWQRDNPEKRKVITKKYRKANPEKTKVATAKWCEENADRNRAQIAKWKRNNKGTVNAYFAKRNALKRSATTSWSEYDQIQELYKQAAQLRVNGIDVHVDHIVPIQSPIVCGLHVLANLQILGARENMSKGNKLLDKYM